MANIVVEAEGAAINSSTSKFAVLPGTATGIFTTPDSTAASIVGDLDIRANVMRPDWTAATVRVIDKDSSAAQKSYALYVINTQKIGFRYYNDGTTGIDATSSASFSFSSGTAHWIRATYVAATGKVNFYTSDDGETWTILGAEQSLSAGAIFDGTSPIQVGSSYTGFFEGRIYRAQIYNGINGTLAVDFNPNLSTTAQTFTAATGEVWTTNGTARIFGNTHATYGIVAPWDASGPVGLLTEAAAENRALQSRTLDVAPWTVGSAANVEAVAANAYVAADGTTTMDKLQTKATNASHYYYQTIAAYSASLYSLYMEARYVNHRWLVVRVNDGTTTRYASFDLLNGVVGAKSANTSNEIYPTAIAGVYRIALKTTTNMVASAGDIVIGLNNADTATLETWNAAGTEVVGIVGVNLVASGIVSTPIPTTTVAVTRPADVDQYVSAGNLSATAMTIAMEITPSMALALTPGRHFATYVDGSNRTEIRSDGISIYAINTTAGAEYYSSIVWTRPAGVTAKVVARFSSVTGPDIWLNGVKGTQNSNPAIASQIGTNFQIGGDGVGSNQDYCAHRNVRIWTKSLPDTECLSLSRTL